MHGERQHDGWSEREKPGFAHPMRAPEVARAIYIVAAAALLAVLVAHTAQILLLAFGGLLFGLVLGKFAHFISVRLRIRAGFALTILVGVLAAILASGAWFLAPQLAEQVRQLLERLPTILEELATHAGDLLGLDVLRAVSEQVQAESDGSTTQQILGNVFGVMSGTFAALFGTFVVIVTALYVAGDSESYRAGMLHLIPKAQRARAADVLDKIGSSLLWWMIGRLVSMSLVGILALLGFWLMGLPLAVPLAIIAALLTFIPYFGPMLSAIPAALVALSESTGMAFYVLGFYAAVQTFEGYLVAPLVQRRTVALPPVVAIVSQLSMGVLAGGLGLAMAVPLVVVALVLIRELWIRNLEQQSAKPT